MTYEEKLFDKRWSEKRAVIFKRDNYCCQECKKGDQIKGKTSYPLIHVDRSGELLFMRMLGDDRFKYIQYKLTLDISGSDKTIMLHNNHPIAIGKDPDISVYIDEIDGQKRPITLFDNKKTQWIYVRNLHTHHRFYHKGLEPWEYPNSALETLCWSCHERLHENELVPVYENFERTNDFVHPCQIFFEPAVSLP